MREPHTVLLTPNEYDLITRLLRDEKAPQIARETKRSVHTVRTTIRMIYSKLDVHSVSQLSGAVARGDLVIHTRPPDSHEPTFDLSSALHVLQSESRRAKGAIWSVKLHRNEIQELLVAGQAYSLLATTESNISSLIERVERIVANAEDERPKIAAAYASALGLQDRAIGIVRATLQIDALAEICANTPFPLVKRARSEVIDAFRSSYLWPFSDPPHPNPSQDG